MQGEFSMVLWTAFQRLNRRANTVVKKGILLCSMLCLFPLLAQAEELDLALAKTQSDTFQKGWQAANRGDLDVAYDIWQTLGKQVIAVPELNRALQNNLAVILIKKKEYQQAEVILNSALKIDLQVATTLQNLNQIYAYQAQKAYKKVFSKTEVIWPQGNFLFFDLDKANLPTEHVLTEMPAFSAERQQETQATLLVKGLLSSWRDAWTSQNVDEYLAFYDKKEFTPKFGRSYKSWKEGRYRSLTNPKFIKIAFDDVQIVQLDKNLIRARFLQKYHSDRFKDDVYKVVLWQLFDGHWRIVQEVVANGKN